MLALAALAALASLAWAATRPWGHILIYAAWSVPLAELALLAIGQWHYRTRFRHAAPGTFRELVIQVTTVGREQQRVREIIAQIRGYQLSMPYQIWVVTEEGGRDSYPAADRVLPVPVTFTAASQHKGRALEYSRLAREQAGLARADVKVLFCDDDVTLTKGYIETAFAADYDVCEGVVAPRTGYGWRPVSHFLASHADDIRTHACLAYCSVFQGVLGRPVHVHGEGLTVTGIAERAVTWNWPVIASEDLVFGQRAASAGLRWGWFHEYAEATSPWSLRDYLVQRRRWLWGDLHGITHRDALPWWGASLVAAKYAAGAAGAVLSAAGLWLRATGRIPPGSGWIGLAKLGLLAWAGVFFATGWIGAGPRRSNDDRLLAGVIAVVMLPVSLALTVAGIVIPLLQGDPGRFEVISKTSRRPVIGEEAALEPA